MPADALPLSSSCQRSVRADGNNKLLPAKRVALSGVMALAATLTTFAPSVFADSSPPSAGTHRWYFNIQALHSHFLVQVGGASTKNGAQVIQWDGPGEMHGQWEYMSKFMLGMGAYPIRNRWTRQCLDVGSTAWGALVVQNPCDGRSSQNWKFDELGWFDGAFHYFIRNDYSGLDLNVGGAAIAIGAPLIQWPRTVGANNSKFGVRNFSGVID
jgi:hypothetical protein